MRGFSFDRVFSILKVEIGGDNPRDIVVDKRTSTGVSHRTVSDAHTTDELCFHMHNQSIALII